MADTAHDRIVEVSGGSETWPAGAEAAPFWPRCVRSTPRDTVVVAERGKTAVAVVTQEFEALSHTMAANAGRSALRVHVLPYPLETRPETDVRKVAQEHWEPLLASLGAASGADAER